MANKQPKQSNKLTPTQARAARRGRRHNRRKVIRWIGGLAVTLIAGLFILSLFLPSIPLDSLFSSGDPDGPGQLIESQGRDHIEEDATHPPYNSTPATSGWHYPQPLAPVKWGIHNQYIQEERRIHNLEHGGISITYNCPEECKQLIENLKEIVTEARSNNLKVLLSPYPNMSTKISLTAWTFIDSLDTYDAERIKKFINSHESSPNAPEPYAN